VSPAAGESLPPASHQGPPVAQVEPGGIGGARRTAVLIYNGKNARRSAPSVPAEPTAEPAPEPPGDRAGEIVALLARHGIDSTLRVTLGRKHATREARAAGKAGVPMVIAAGGDGTVSAVVRGLRGTRTALGIVPLGRRNAIATSRGVPSDLTAACAALGARGQVEGQAEGQTEEQPGAVNEAAVGWWGGQPMAQAGIAFAFPPAPASGSR
jgi:hypothetical protein